MLEFHSLLKHPDDLLMSCQQFLHTCLSQELGCSPPLLGNLTDGDQRHLFGIPMFVWIGPVLRILPASAATKYGLKTFLDLKKKTKDTKEISNWRVSSCAMGQRLNQTEPDVLFFTSLKPS